MGTVTLVWPAAEAASTPLAYQRMESASRYLPPIFAWKVQLPPTAALPLLLICTGATMLFFSIFYVITYLVTANVYYRIVSGASTH